MATTRKHVSFFWGALDIDQASTENPYYAPTDYATLGDDATQGGGVGVRRATLVFERTLMSPADDAVLMHFDFLNLTSDDPDDTWTAADFIACETRLSAWWNACAGFASDDLRLTRYYWHRVGKGISKPNPAVRITDILSPVAGTVVTNPLPQQVASVISLRHGSRPSWGRTYFPWAKALTDGRIANADCDTLATQAMLLLTNAKLDDFLLVVTSMRHDQAFVVDRIVVDNVPDIQRPRRIKHTTYRKILDAP